MPRKKPEELKSKAAASTTTDTTSTTETTTTAAPTTTVAPPPISSAPATPTTPTPTGFHPADINGDGVVSQEEYEMEMEFRRKALEDADAMRDAQRKMAWFSLAGMLLYPFAVVLAVAFSLDQAANVLGSMAATYFVSVAAIVAAFFGGQAYAGKQASKR